jgi:hypothetical protein
MTYTQLLSASFGQANTGLTMGYTVIDETGATVVARTTAGVSERGDSGVYEASAEFDTAWGQVRVVWYPDENPDKVASEVFDTRLILATQAQDLSSIETAIAGLDTDLAAVGAAVSALGAAQVSASQSGADVSGTTLIVRSRTYSEATGGTSLEFTVRNFDLSAATSVQIWDGNTSLGAGSKALVPDPDGDYWLLSFELDDSVTATLMRTPDGTRNLELVAFYNLEPAHIAFVPVEIR